MPWDSFWIRKSQLESSEKEPVKQSWESQLVLCWSGEMAKVVLGLSGLEGAEYPKPDNTQWPGKST